MSLKDKIHAESQQRLQGFVMLVTEFTIILIPSFLFPHFNIVTQDFEVQIRVSILCDQSLCPSASLENLHYTEENKRDRKDVLQHTTEYS